MPNTDNNKLSSKAWIITGPTSGFGLHTAPELAKHGTVVLVGRNPNELAVVEAEIEEQKDGHAVSVVCDGERQRTLGR